MISDLRGKSVLITGAAGGIGDATAKRFASLGARVAAIDLRAPVSGACQSLLDAGAEKAVVLSCDVADEAEVKSVYAQVTRELGAPQVLINIAGKMIYKAFADLTREDWIGSLSVNLMGAVFFMRQAFLGMAGGGAIVNISSIHAHQTSALVAPYAAAKAALLSATRSAAIEGRQKGIRVNAVLPGAIDTEMLRESPNIKSGQEKLEAADIGTAADIAAAITFLASNDASFITGASLIVDGGRLSRL
jgi:NAD(P)-dependent dehydrogenase (short-subunit alcohol dehydrogenase family)